MLSILKKPSNQSVVWFFCLNICDKNIVFFGKCDTVGTIFCYRLLIHHLIWGKKCPL